MAALPAAVNRLVDLVAERTGSLGNKVALDESTLLDRSDSVALHPPGRISANGSCRLLETLDGWLAINLPRQDDFTLLPALMGRWSEEPGWEDLARHVSTRRTRDVVASATELGLAASRLGEREETSPLPRLLSPAQRRHRSGRGLKVVDLSTLWAGPLCGAIFAKMGARVIKIDNPDRPDPTARQHPFHDRLNGAKQRMTARLSDPAGWDGLLDLVSSADILITSARPRAFEAAGWTLNTLRDRNPGLVWVAITAHGWREPAGLRIGYGDDATVAGGLVCWSEDRRQPAFAGDALADPLTGLAAAASACGALLSGQSGLIDASLAGTAAGVHHWLARSDNSENKTARAEALT